MRGAGQLVVLLERRWPRTYQYFNRRIPDDAHYWMGQLAPQGITTFAFTPANGWVIVTQLGQWVAAGVPDECVGKLGEMVAAGHRVHCVAFPPAGGNSWVITTDRGLFARNIPDECYTELVNLYGRGEAAAHVAFPPAGGNSWVILGVNGFLFARDIDDECYQIMRNFKNGGRWLTRVAFPYTGGWAVVVRDDVHTRGIDNECYVEMHNFLLRGYEVHNVAFSPVNNGWSLSSRGAPPALPPNRVRQVEMPVGGGNIWQRMAAYNTPGAAIAVVLNNRVAWSTGYGWLEVGSAAAAHPESVFQAASVSKAVATVGVMRLLQTRAIAETNDIRSYLGWIPPVRPCLTGYQVPSIARALTHTAGITGRGNTYPLTSCSGYSAGGGGYPGYGPNATVPTLLQVMNGQGTNTPKIEISSSAFGQYYSGAGFVLLQRMIEQQTAQTLSTYMRAEGVHAARHGQQHL